MKKITIISMMIFSIIANAQLVDNGIDAVDLKTGTNQIRPNSQKGDKNTGFWWASGYLELVNGAAKYTSNKGPTLRQKVALTQDVEYTISFDAWIEDDPDEDTKPILVFFVKDPGNIVIDGSNGEPGMAVDVDGVIDANNKWKITPTNTSSQTFTTKFTPASTDEYIICLQRSSGADVMYVDNIYMSSATATDGNTLAKLISVFPNPTNAMLHVEAKSNIQSLRLINSLGVTVKHKSVESNSVALNLSDLPSGLYVLNVITESGNHTRTILVE